MMTTKRIALTISGLWLMTLAFGILSVVNYNEYEVIYGVCLPKDHSRPLLLLVVSGSPVLSMCIITGTCIYLHYKIIHFNRFFKSVKRNSYHWGMKGNKGGKIIDWSPSRTRKADIFHVHSWWDWCCIQWVRNHLAYSEKDSCIWFEAVPS